MPAARSVLLTLALAATVSAQTPAKRSSCELCHSAAAAQHRGSAHGGAGLTCITCHGGDPNDHTIKAMAPSVGFRGTPRRANQPAFCANCHAKQDAMRPYGIPTDQYELYQQSGHGQALAAGRTKAAVCSDCHTAHAIRDVEDPRASVSRANLPKTCARCHDDAKLMAAAGLPSGQYAAFAGSVHGQALIQGQSKDAPTCASCHGSHGAKPPLAESLDLVCAQCHPNTVAAFQGGPHGKAAAAGKMTPCVSCHGAHAIHRPNDELLKTSCVKCHAPDSAPAKLGQRIHDDIGAARTSFAHSEKVLQNGHGQGLPREQLTAALDEARTALLKSAVAQHAVQPREVERETVVVRATAEDLKHELEELRERLYTRVLVIAYFCGFLLVSIAAFWTQRQRGQRKWLENRGDQP